MTTKGNEKELEQRREIGNILRKLERQDYYFKQKLNGNIQYIKDRIKQESMNPV